MRLPEKLTSMTPYVPVTARYPVRLDANESFLPLPEELRRALAARLADEVAYNRYPDPAASALCAAAAAYYGVPEDCVTAGNGSDELISVLMNSFLSRGDTVLVTAPDFSMYAFYAALAEADLAALPKSALAFTAEELIAEARRVRAQLVIFSNPCNPTGCGLCKEDVLHIIDSVDALVVVDEAYMEFWDQSVLPEALSRENALVLRTCSKALGLAAARLGFALANRRLTGYFRAAKSPFNVSALSQLVGETVLRDGAHIRACTQAICESRAALARALSALAERYPGALTVYPGVTNFVLIRPRSAAACHRALLACGVSVRLMGEYLRVTAGSAEENAAFLRAFGDILQRGGN